MWPPLNTAGPEKEPRQHALDRGNLGSAREETTTCNREAAASS